MGFPLYFKHEISDTLTMLGNILWQSQMQLTHFKSIFGGPFVKRFALCYRTVVCLAVLSVSNVGVLWPNGWTD